MSKGSNRRPPHVPQRIADANWERTFGSPRPTLITTKEEAWQHGMDALREANPDLAKRWGGKCAEHTERDTDQKRDSTDT